MVTFGYFLQFFNWCLLRFLSFDSGFFIRLILFLAGMLLSTAGMSLYMSCNLGMVPYDCVSFIISGKTAINAFVVRVIVDFCVAVLALAAGGPINVGTVLLAFGAVSYTPLDVYKSQV